VIYLMEKSKNSSNALLLIPSSISLIAFSHIYVQLTKSPVKIGYAPQWKNHSFLFNPVGGYVSRAFFVISYNDLHIIFSIFVIQNSTLPSANTDLENGITSPSAEIIWVISVEFLAFVNQMLWIASKHLFRWG